MLLQVPVTSYTRWSVPTIIVQSDRMESQVFPADDNRCQQRRKTWLP